MLKPSKNHVHDGFKRDVLIIPYRKQNAFIERNPDSPFYGGGHLAGV